MECYVLCVSGTESYLTLSLCEFTVPDKHSYVTHLERLDAKRILLACVMLDVDRSGMLSSVCTSYQNMPYNVIGPARCTLFRNLQWWRVTQPNDR